MNRTLSSHLILISLWSVLAVGLAACGRENGDRSQLSPTLTEQAELEAMNTNAPLVEPHLPGPGENPSLAPQGEHVSERTGGVGLVRVKIFPHDHSSSNIPQGRDTTTTSVLVKSSGPCTLQQGSRQTASPSLSVTLTPGKLAQPLMFDCRSPIQVVRAQGTDYSYAGKIEATRGTYKSGKQFVRLVNIIDHEDYLKGVVPAEVSASWPSETLKAQAVAARSYSLAIIRIKEDSVYDRTGEYDLDDTIYYQAYTGINKSDPRTDEAVEETRGQVLISGTRVAQTFFSADAGGHTESSEGAWGAQKLPYCRAKKEPFDYRLNPNSDWSKKISLNALTRYASQVAKTSGASVRALSVGSANRTSSGRAARVVYTLLSGTKTSSGTSFASAFGLKSNFFTPSVSGSQVVLTGRGFGHGVGMSQWGAKILAQNSGWSYRQILEFYYDDTRLIRLVNQSL